MTVLIVASRSDVAALNIARELINRHSFRQESTSGCKIYAKGEVLLSYVDVESIYAENVCEIAPADCFIFASQHQSVTHEPTLTVHATGNVTAEARFGGKPKSLGWADPLRMRSALLSLKRAAEAQSLKYHVSLEATHHGPTELQKPVFFVEIGSSEECWSDAKAIEVATEAIWEAATKREDVPVAVGFGGGHYCPKHTKAIEEMNLAVGHVLSKHFFSQFDRQLARTAFLKTVGDANIALIDKKGIGGPGRRELLKFLRDEGIEAIMI
jgi:D-aminoacyl-tRNA deacylase